MLLRVIFIALLAFKSFPSVRSNVPIKVGTIIEAFFTKVALMGLFVGMGYLVPCQQLFRAKRIRALGALVRFLLDVFAE